MCFNSKNNPRLLIGSAHSTLLQTLCQTRGVNFDALDVGVCNTISRLLFATIVFRLSRLDKLEQKSHFWRSFSSFWRFYCKNATRPLWQNWNITLSHHFWQAGARLFGFSRVSIGNVPRHVKFFGRNLYLEQESSINSYH